VDVLVFHSTLGYLGACERTLVGQTVSVVATCPAGYIVTGGGRTNAFSGVVISNNAPLPPDRWDVGFYNGSSVNRLMFTYALCISF
jgi:hypothetical protein